MSNLMMGGCKGGLSGKEEKLRSHGFWEQDLPTSIYLVVSKE
jgi:hypothetical protein